MVNIPNNDGIPNDKHENFVFEEKDEHFDIEENTIVVIDVQIRIQDKKTLTNRVNLIDNVCVEIIENLFHL